LDCHLAAVEGLASFYDPESLAGGGVASGRYNQTGKINGEIPDQRAVTYSPYSDVIYDKNLCLVFVTMDISTLIVP